MIIELYSIVLPNKSKRQVSTRHDPAKYDELSMRALDELVSG